ncbi:transcription factor bHLH91-like [Argentina anserina]|uniref:transcription factor bHLH91-like n=1 Tax=Argentina anserina TaxID=57926 RepID=UPI00217658A3|nr:transcription factor bHLH91-like [Potentilla anserina]
MEEDLSNYHHHLHHAMEIEQQQLQNITASSHLLNPFETQQETNWGDSNNEMQQQQLPPIPTPDLLSLFHLPETASGVMYDPMFQLPPPPQPFREQLLPYGCNSSLFSNGGDTHLFENGVLEFSKEMKPFGRGRGGNKGTKHFATERQRRVQLNDKFTALRELVPSPTKPDRASVVGDAIDYIQELKRTVSELKRLVDKKRCGRERSKRHKTEQDIGAGDDDESCNKPLGDPDHDHSYNNGSLRSSWLKRKSKDTEVDVRIIDDEVTIKLIQRKKINLLLSVSKILDGLQLELHHAAGGHIGNSYSFLFNTKMYEGSSLYASAIANKLIDALDGQYAAIPPSNSY